MQPTSEQTKAGWRKLPSYEEWNATVALGRVWQRLNEEGDCDSDLRTAKQTYCQRYYPTHLYRPVNPHTWGHWPLPVSVRMEIL